MYQCFSLGVRGEGLVALGCGFPEKALGLIGDINEAFVPIVDKGVEAEGFVVADDFVDQSRGLDDEHVAAGDIKHERFTCIAHVFPWWCLTGLTCVGRRRIGLPSSSENPMKIVEEFYAMSCLTLNHSHSIAFQTARAVLSLPMTTEMLVSFQLEAY